MKKLFLLALAATAMLSCSKERFIDDPGNLVPMTVDQDPSLPSISVKGSMLHSEAFGPADSTLIICIHGGPGGDYRYMLNCKDLAQYGFRVVFYDQRGSGLSQRFPEDSYRSLGAGAVDLMYNELSDVIDYYRTHEGQKVILLGHSWGGILATGYAGRYPAKVQGLIVGEPGGLKWNDIKEYVSDSRSFNIWGEAFNDAVYLDQFLTGKKDQHEILDYKMGMMASKNEITGDDSTTPDSKWRSGAVINTALFQVGMDCEPDFSSGIHQFQKTVLFFYSEKNKSYTDAWASKISGAYPSAVLQKVAGVGHDGIVKDRTAWTQITMPRILSYLRSI